MDRRRNMLIGIVVGIVIGGALTYATGLANLFLAPHSSSAEYKSSESVIAPELATGEWINSEPLKLADLRGRVVLIDFWTFGCYNCRNTLPFVKSWNDRYREKGLTVIGVHSPEFDQERKVESLRNEIFSLGITYPVVTDNVYKTWNAYKVEAWPTVFLIDKQGRIRWMHVGEGDYATAERLIQKLLAEEPPLETSDSTSHPRLQCSWNVMRGCSHCIRTGLPGSVAPTLDFIPAHKEQQMNDLLEQAVAAHGGLDRWNKFTEVTATMIGGGGLWPMKGFEPAPIPTEVTVTLHEENASISPFGQPDWRVVFTPDRVAIETTGGAIVEERANPRAAFAGHVMNTPWDLLHRAYFSGYARWTYLNTPFLMTMPGFEITELPPWQEGDEVWRGLRARFPDGIASHSKEQDFYFGDDFLLRRHDYNVEVAGGFPAAQYVYDIVEANGLRFPTKRRAYLRGPGLKPIRDLLLVSIHLSNFRLR